MAARRANPDDSRLIGKGVWVRRRRDGTSPQFGSVRSKTRASGGPKWGSAGATAISWITGSGTGRWRLATPEWGAASTLSHEK